MKKWALVLVLLLAIPTWGEKKYKLVTDSPEDIAVIPIEEETNAEKRLLMLAEFTQEFADSAALPFTYHLYAEAYLELKQYDKAVKYGEMAVVDADDENLSWHMTLIRASLGTQDYARVHKWSAAALSLYEAVKEEPMDDLDPGQIEDEQAKLNNYVAFLEYALFEAAARDNTPERLTYVESFAKSFPESERIKQLPALYAVAYQLRNDTPKVVEYAKKVLEGEPGNENMLLLLAETQIFLVQAADPKTRKPEQMEEVRLLAQRLLEVVEAKSTPEGVSEANWEQHLNNFRGASHSILGRILMMQNKTEDALKELAAAAPLLEGNPQALNPVLYFQGLGHVILRRNREARPMLERCAEMGGAYSQLAAALLKKLPRKRRR